MATLAGGAVVRRWERHNDDADIAAVRCDRDGHEAGWLNTRLVTCDDDLSRVDGWADREVADGRRCSILYAGELASLGA